MLPHPLLRARQLACRRGDPARAEAQDLARTDRVAARGVRRVDDEVRALEHERPVHRACGVTTTTTSLSSTSAVSGTEAIDDLSGRSKVGTCGSWYVTDAPACDEAADDVGRRRVACVANIRLEGDADDPDPGALAAPGHAR